MATEYTLTIYTRPYWIERIAKGDQLFAGEFKNVGEKFIAFKGKWSKDNYYRFDWVYAINPENNSWNGWGDVDVRRYFKVLHPLTGKEIRELLKHKYTLAGVNITTLKLKQ